MTYKQFLNHVVDEIFSKAKVQQITWSGLAKRAKLCPQTVQNLGTRKTKLPQLRTVYQLCKAVGIEVQLVKRRIRLAA